MSEIGRAALDGRRGKMDLAAATGEFEVLLGKYRRALLQTSTKGSFCSAEHILLTLLLASVFSSPFTSQEKKRLNVF